MVEGEAKPEETVTAPQSAWIERTFKREVAVAMLVLVTVGEAVCLGKLFVYTPSDPAMVTAIGTAFGQIFGTFATMAFSFAGLAFGLDAWAKQLQEPKP